MGIDPFVERERIRKDLENYPADLVDWEASCLKNVADLLDSLERARGEWGSLSARLHDAEERILRLTHELDEAGEAAVDRDTARQKAAELREEVENIRLERDALAENRRDVEALREELASAREELDKAADAEEQLVETRRKLVDLEGAHEGLEAVQAELEDTRAELDRARVEQASLRRQLAATRDELADSREQSQVAARERDALRGGSTDLEQAVERIEKLEREREALRKECEENTVLVCDYRVRLNRLELERDDALKEGRRKVKKILGRVHESLDEAGAPSGEEMSFGERIRRLKNQSLGIVDFDEDDVDQTLEF